MKILFVYFNEKRICRTAGEAVDFINSLHCRNNPHCQPLVVNQRTDELLHDLFRSEWHTEGSGFPYVEVIKETPVFVNRQRYHTGHDIRTTGCCSTSIKMYYTEAETVEEHDAMVERANRERAEQARQRREAELTRRYAELSEKREGWYSVSLTYTRLGIRDMRTIETTFSGKCIASSGMEAYQKAIKELEKDGEASLGAYFPEPTSGNYSFLFLGVKTDDGYTYKEWEE